MRLSDIHMNRLLGKWRVQEEQWRPARGFYLPDHMEEVLWGFDLLFSQPFGEAPSFGQALHSAMALPISFDDFQTRCLLATALHDLGKCCGEFQKMLWDLEDYYNKHQALNPNRYKQAFRHEFASGLLLFYDLELRRYVEHIVGPGRPFFSVLAGAAGHHLKATPALGAGGFDQPGWKPKKVYLGAWANGLRPLLAAKGLPFLPNLRNITSPNYLLNKDAIDRAWGRIKAEAQSVGDATDAAIKWVVMLSDVLGSVDRPGGNKDVRQSLAEEMQRIGAPVSTDVLTRAFKKLGHDPVYNAAQQQAASATGNMILTASTGGGKTIAAFAWASSNSARLIFAAHTTDAASVLHQDYGMDGDVVKHSRSHLPLYLTPTPEDNSADQVAAEVEADATVSLFQDGLAPITFCTVDQVVGLIAFSRKSIMWLPYILASQIVFDEVHSYDDQLRGWYHRFLSYFPKIRTAHLSATLADNSIRDIKTSANTQTLIQQTDNKPRYRIVVLDAPPSVMPDRCLWFCNTVARCQQIAMEHGAYAYHSRFKYADRIAAKNELIHSFRSSSNNVRVVATQCAEMSLDVDADVMISEIAPPEAMIQRLGRLNRKGVKGVCTLYVYLHATVTIPGISGFPYVTGADWLFQYLEWKNWLKQFENKNISQDDLDRAFSIYTASCPINVTRATLPSQIETVRLSVRESSPAVAAVLEADIGLLKQTNTRDMLKLHEFSVVLPEYTVAKLKRYPERTKTHVILPAEEGHYDRRYGWFVNSTTCQAIQ